MKKKLIARAYNLLKGIDTPKAQQLVKDIDEWMQRGHDLDMARKAAYDAWERYRRNEENTDRENSDWCRLNNQ